MSNQKWENNAIQFPRLLAEISATQELDIPALSEAMDLSIDDVNELLDRADRAWEDAKAGDPGLEVSASTLRVLLSYAEPALEKECDELGKAGQAASEYRQAELEAIAAAKRALSCADIKVKANPRI